MRKDKTGDERKQSGKDGGREERDKEEGFKERSRVQRPPDHVKSIFGCRAVKLRGCNTV